MNHGSNDLTTEDIERLAAEVWDAAAREALAKGLPVTGYHDGHLFRYHPGKGIEDFTSGRIGSESAATDTDGDARARQAVAPEASDTNGREVVAPPLPPAACGDAPADMGNTAEPGQSHPADHDMTVTSAAEDAPAVSPALTDYTMQAIEFVRWNTNATLEFTARLFAAKTLVEVVELSTAHFCSQLDAFSSRGDHAAQPSPDRGDETAEPVKKVG